MSEELKVKVEGGYLIATKSCEEGYPGIDVEFIADKEDETALSNPRVLFEKPVDGKLRVLVWSNKAEEDYTTEIEFQADINNQTALKFEDGSGALGVCPCCGGDELLYGEPEKDNTGLLYPWECMHCHCKGEETYEVTFTGHYKKN